MSLELEVPGRLLYCHADLRVRVPRLWP
jgi:hypothetical protein